MKTKILLALFIAGLFYNYQTVHSYYYTYTFRWHVLTYYVPENIEYLEYCLYSGECEVPEKYEKLITANAVLIMSGYEPLYK